MLRRGQIVKVEFLDHVEGMSDPLKFVVYGKLTSIKRASLTVDTWHYASKKYTDSANLTRHTIVRSAITRITLLKEVRE